MLSWAESPDSSSPGVGSGGGGGTSIHPDVLKGRVSSWPGLMIPAAHITGWWEQVAEARLTIQGMGLAKFGGTSCGPLSPFPNCPTLVKTLIFMYPDHYSCLSTALLPQPRPAMPPP